VNGAYSELAAQVQADGALIAKLFGLLAFFAIIGTFLLGEKHPLDSGRFLLVAGAAVGIVGCLVGTMNGTSPATGPTPATFYAEYGGREEARYLAQLLVDLGSDAQKNVESLAKRQLSLNASVGIPAVFAVAFIVVNVAGLN
jgi:hypothetical protein